MVYSLNIYNKNYFGQNLYTISYYQGRTVVQNTQSISTTVCGEGVSPWWLVSVVCAWIRGHGVRACVCLGVSSTVSRVSARSARRNAVARAVARCAAGCACGTGAAERSECVERAWGGRGEIARSPNQTRISSNKAWCGPVPSQHSAGKVQPLLSGLCLELNKLLVRSLKSRGQSSAIQNTHRR